MKKITYILSLSAFVFFTTSFSVSALTVSPARLEIKADPGETITGEVLLINDQNDTQTFYTSSEKFEAQGETGTPTFASTKEGLASWIQVEEKITLGKGEQKKIAFTVNVPKDADAGGHFAAIFLSTVPQVLQEGQVSVGAKIGVLLLLKVSGAVKEGGGVLDFKTKDDSSFFTTLPIALSYRFQNSGGDRVNPAGTIVINNTFGFESKTLDANPSKGNVLPESIRRFDVEWGTVSASSSKGFFTTARVQLKQFAFGFYTLHLHLSYGTNGVSDSSKTIFVFPWQLLLLILVILIVTGLILKQIIVRYNRWIIKQAQQSMSQK